MNCSVRESYRRQVATLIGLIVAAFPSSMHITYICASCGVHATVPFLSVEVFEDGTTLTCDKCGRDTIVNLREPWQHSAPGSYRRARALLPWQEGDELPEEAIRRLRGGCDES